MKKVFIMTILALVCCTSAYAQGPYLGGGFTYNDPVGSDIEYLRPGPGLHFTFGYDMGPAALEGTLLGSRHDDTDFGYGDADMSGFSIDLKFFLSRPLAVDQFYLLAGYGSYSIYEYDPLLRADTELNGSGWNLGAGVEHYLNSNMALNFGITYRFISFDEFGIEGEIFSLRPREDGDTVSIQLGLNYHF